MTVETTARPAPLTPADSNGRGPEVEIAHVRPHEDPAAQHARQQRFAAGLRALRTGGGTLRLGERILLVLGGIIAPTGVVIVLLGWWGASRTPFVFEQVPYLISGGLFGLALVFLGAFFYFAHWLTELVREHRAQSAAIVEALSRLQDQVARLGDAQPGRTVIVPAGIPDGDAVLVATARGTMAHRPECVVVAGKSDLRSVTPADGLAACKLCEPAPTT